MLNFHYVAYVPSDDGADLVPYDTSYDRKPYLVKHGNGFTCEGLEEALHSMKVGGRRRVILPPALGFTANKGPLPPSKRGMDTVFEATQAKKSLVFDLELVAVMDDLLDRGDYEELSWNEAFPSSKASQPSR
jgi:hypothetical protein